MQSSQQGSSPDEIPERPSSCSTMETNSIPVVASKNVKSPNNDLSSNQVYLRQQQNIAIIHQHLATQQLEAQKLAQQRQLAYQPQLAYQQHLYLQQIYNKCGSASSQYSAQMNQNYAMYNNAPNFTNAQNYAANQQHSTKGNNQQSRRRSPTNDRRSRFRPYDSRRR